MASGSISEGLSADRCFLLSREEAYRYFENDIQRQLRSSVADNNNGNAHSWWWLRSVGYYVNSAAVVYSDGGISSCGVHIGLSGGVRPAGILSDSGVISVIINFMISGIVLWK